MKKILTIIAAAVIAVGANAQELANFARQGQGQQIVSPEVKDGKVTFRLNANYATQVKLSGNWMANPWTGTIDMQKGPNGIWEVTIDAPEPEITALSGKIGRLPASVPKPPTRKYEVTDAAWKAFFFPRELNSAVACYLRT